MEQELSEIASRKKDALSTFENVTKTIISDEIIASHKENLDRLKQELDQVSADLRSLEGSIKEQNIQYYRYLRPSTWAGSSAAGETGTAFQIYTGRFSV